MTVTTRATIARLSARIRLVVLVALALLVAHDAIYVAEYGIGDRFAAGMRDGGHDAYWLPFTLIVVVAALAAFLVGVALVARLQRQAGRRTPVPGPSYLAELGTTWKRLLPVVVALFTLQENIEHLASHGHVAGLEPLGGPGYELALPVLALTTLVLAAAGALLRWRIAVLRRRIEAAPSRWRRPAAVFASRAWLTTLAIHEWLHDRRDAGRAPPYALRPGTSPTA
jgi:hypothetical protein